MAIDDPQDAIENQLKAEERSDSLLQPYVAGLAEVLEVLPRTLLPEGVEAVTAGLAKATRWFIDRKQEERRKVLLDVLGSELRYVKARLENLNDEQARFVREEFPDLVLDGLQKAERTRSQDRITRIGRILAHAAIDTPVKPSDVSEELARIAMALDDIDVQVLAELVRGQREAFNSSLGRVPNEPVNNYWRSGDIASDATPASPRAPRAGRQSGVAVRLDMPEGELQARCAKLQAFGLAVQTDRNEMKNPPGVLPYAILMRGIEFIDAVRTLANTR